MNVVLNFVLFQVGWFAVILLAARGDGDLALAAGLGFTILHLMLVSQRRLELKLLLPALPFGFVVDSALAATGAVEYADAFGDGLCAPWILTLWLLFAATFRHSFRWILGKRLVPMLLGAIVAPISYAGGARLGAVTIGDPFERSVVVIAIVWAVALLLAVKYADRVLAAHPLAGPVPGVQPDGNG
jgi:hypothetical protein